MNKDGRIPIKFDSTIKIRILELIPYKSRKEIAASLGVSYWTLLKWIKSDTNFKKQCEVAKKEGARDIIKYGLFQRAMGVEETTVSKEYAEVEILEDGTERLVKKKVTTKKLPPDVSALKLIANKYARGEYSDKEEVKLSVSITAKHQAMSFEEKVKLLHADATEGQDIIEADYKEIEERLEKL